MTGCHLAPHGLRGWRIYTDSRAPRGAHRLALGAHGAAWSPEAARQCHRGSSQSLLFAVEAACQGGRTMGTTEGWSAFPWGGEDAHTGTGCPRGVRAAEEPGLRSFRPCWRRCHGPRGRSGPGAAGSGCSSEVGSFPLGSVVTRGCAMWKDRLLSFLLLFLLH